MKISYSVNKISLVFCILQVSIQGEGKFLSTHNRETAFIGYSETGKHISSRCIDTSIKCISYAQDGLCNSPGVLRTCKRSCNACPGQATRPDQPLLGSANVPATRDYARKYRRYQHGHFRSVERLTLSTIGIGTNSKMKSPEDQNAMRRQSTAIVTAVLEGVNVIDTALHHQQQLAEAAVGKAITELRTQHHIPREALFISTKIGYLTGDAAVGEGSEEAQWKAMAAHVKPSDIIRKKYCVAPYCVRELFSQSLRNLQLDTVDVLYLQDAAEMLIPVVGRYKFMERMLASFNMLEELRSKGLIRYYGLSAWRSLAVPQAHPLHVNLEEVVELAQQAGGFERHGFAFIQVPVNVNMPEVWRGRWQTVQDATNLTIIEAAESLGIGVFGIAPIQSGDLLNSGVTKHVESNPSLNMVENLGAKFVQVSRSVPGIISVIVGQSHVEHVKSNAMVLDLPLLTVSQFETSTHPF